MSGLVAVVSTCSAAAPLVVAGYIAEDGTHIVSFPAILTAAVLSPPSTAFKSPVPFGAITMFPFAPSVIVIVPELVPEFVSKIKLCAPLDVIVASAAPVPNTVSPLPFGLIAISIFESPPVADNVGSFPVAAFAIVNSFTAEPVAVNKNNSAPLVSKIEVPILGEVKVLFVKVSVDEAVINPQSSISGLVPSLAVA